MTIHTQLPDNIGTATAMRAFLAGDEGHNWIQRLAKSSYFQRYEQDYRHSMSLKQCNDIAGQYIGEHYGEVQPWSAADAIPQREPFECWQYEIIPELKPMLAERDIDIDDIEDDLRPEWEAAIDDHDASRPTDAFSPHDRCELIFIFRDTKHVIDGLCQCRGAWPDFDNMCVDDNLQHSLIQLGHTIGSYRRHTKNMSEGLNVRPGRRPQREATLSLDDIAVMVENACSINFAFVVYGIVQLKELITLDLAKPVRFKQGRIAVYDPINGTFHDHHEPVEIVVEAHQGKFVSGSDYYSPDDICGLVQRHYHAGVENASPTQKGKGERRL